MKHTHRIYKSYKPAPILSTELFIHNLQLSQTNKLQLSNLTMDPRNERQPFLPQPFVNLFMMMLQLLELQASTIPWCGSFDGSPSHVGPVYQGMPPQQHRHQYRAPSSGPTRNQGTKGFRKAETQSLNKILHESSGVTAGDHSTGIRPGYTRIGVNDNAGACKVWSTPPRNPLMADHKLNPADEDETI